MPCALATDSRLAASTGGRLGLASLRIAACAQSLSGFFGQLGQQGCGRCGGGAGSCAERDAGADLVRPLDEGVLVLRLWPALQQHTRSALLHGHGPWQLCVSRGTGVAAEAPLVSTAAALRRCGRCARPAQTGRAAQSVDQPRLSATIQRGGRKEAPGSRLPAAAPATRRCYRKRGRGDAWLWRGWSMATTCPLLCSTCAAPSPRPDRAAEHSPALHPVAWGETWPYPGQRKEHAGEGGRGRGALHGEVVHRFVERAGGAGVAAQDARLPHGVLVREGLPDVPGGLQEDDLVRVHADAVVRAVPGRVDLHRRDRRSLPPLPTHSLVAGRSESAIASGGSAARSAGSGRCGAAQGTEERVTLPGGTCMR